MKPDAVIFDIGNVLITWHPEKLYDALMSPDERRAMFASVDLHTMNDRIDHGENWRDVVYATASVNPEYTDMIRLWHDRWAEMATPSISKSWHILRRLRQQGTPVFALSNFGIETFAFAETLYPELAEFDRRFISGHMGVTKPARRIYEMVEAETGLSGAQLFFADDRQENIDAAEALGWQGHVFTSPDGLEDELVRLGALKAC
ncbi:MAG: HAD family phosphatase [Rhodobacteraceae bacterium]|nr:HAD family phosphatase [Paracoccaceae bacterium]